MGRVVLSFGRRPRDPSIARVIVSVCFLFLKTTFLLDLTFDFNKIMLLAML
jgi:hypothetical protein